ncbi:MAG: SCO family protein [Chitinophagaceae bacterium]|nr:SCO family protein [Oligoflexus sp.]
MKNFKLVAGTLLVIGLLFAVVSYYESRSDTVKLSATEITTPYEVGDFQLTDINNQPFSKAQFLGKYTILYFGFTRCPDACPTALAQFRAEIPKLSDDAQKKVQFVMVSIDPQSDTLPLLKKYVEGFHPDIKAATGTDAELHKIADYMKTVYDRKEENAGDPNLYMMAHSPRYFLIDPQARLAAVYNPPLAPGALSSDLNNLAANMGKTKWLF